MLYVDNPKERSLVGSDIVGLDVGREAIGARMKSRELFKQGIVDVLLAQEAHL